MASMTIEEIARLANVSRSTVSRVLNHHPSVRDSVRQRVQTVINEQGYMPDAAARSLARRRSNVIGLVIPRSVPETFSDPFFGPVIHSITEASMRAGYFLMLAMLTVDMEREFYQRILRSRHFDGVLMLSSDIDDPILPLLIKDKIPLVLFGGHPYFREVSWVEAEHREGARQAIQHLIALGHRRIATITGKVSQQAALDRHDGYKQALLEAQLPLLPELIVHGDWSQQRGYSAMQQLLALDPRPTALFAANDATAIGAMRAIQEAGYAVPNDVAVVAFDDLPIALFSNPQLSTIHQPLGEMSATAVQLLIDRIEHPHQEPQHILLPTRLVVRESCGGIAT